MSYIGNPPVNGVFRKLDTIAASFDGSTTSFNLTSGGAPVFPGLTTNLIISLGGIIQEPNTAYTISGSTISFTAAPPAGTSFWGIQLGDVGLAQTPNQNAMTTQVFTATAGQTTFTVNGGYTPGQLQVLRNGVQLVVGVDVTATDGSTFVLTNPATLGDTVVSIAYVSFIVANAVAKSGDTMSGALTINSDLSYTGTLTGSTGVANIGSGQFYKDASGNVGLGTTTPGYKVEAFGTDSGIIVHYFSQSRGGIFALSGQRLALSSTASSDDLVFGYGGGDPLTSANFVERMRLDNGTGNLRIGTTGFTDPDNSRICIVTSANPSDWGRRTLTLEQTNQPAIGFHAPANSAAGVFKFWGGASEFECRNAADNAFLSIRASAFNVSSDYRLKEDIEPLGPALAKINQLKPVSFTWKDSGEGAEGFIAHELQQIIPTAVSGEKDKVLEDGTPIYQGVDASKLVPMLVKAVQELKAELDDAKARIAALEAKQ